MDTRTKTMKIEKLHKLLALKISQFLITAFTHKILPTKAHGTADTSLPTKQQDLHYLEKQPIALPH
jgi:phospholipase/lecithinase/hemolysin